MTAGPEEKAAATNPSGLQARSDNKKRWGEKIMNSSAGHAERWQRREAPPRAEGRLGRLAWALFDWANQPFFTVVTTFIFAPYFTSRVIGDPVAGQSIWGYAMAAAGLLIAVLSPVFGSIADVGGPRKPWIAAFCALCAAGSFALWWAVPDIQEGLFFILAALVLATTGVEFAIVFNNAMLPSLARPSRIGFWSGFGWGIGYLGGLVALALIYLLFILPDNPLLGLDKHMGEDVRITGPFSALWLIVFVLPMFLFTPDEPRRNIPLYDAIARGWQQIRGTLKTLSDYRNITRFLIARMLYNDAIAAIIGFAGIYAVGLFGWPVTTMGAFAVFVIVFAIAGSLIGGWLDDALGSKRTIILSVLGLCVSVLGVISIGDGRAMFFVPVDMPVADGGMFASTAERVFLFFGAILGLCFGPAQAASRTMLARIAPPAMMTEFFGLYALSGKATAFLAPMLIALITDWSGSQRPGFAVILALLLGGLVLVLPIREEQSSS